MANTHLTLNVVTPTGKALATDVEFVKFMTTGGEMGILPDHSPALASVVSGEVVIHPKGKEETSSFFVSAGTVEVLPDKVTLLTPYLEKIDDIDVERAKKAKERARRHLDKKSDGSVDTNRAENALKRAEARISIVEQLLK